jgi:lysophospholipase L1-like esterase
MKINFLGDSITQGAGASCRETQYVSVVGEILGCEVRNYGEGGTRIAKQITPSKEAIYDRDFLMRCDEMSDDADLVFVFGGTNDYGHGDAPLGELDSMDEYTFCGAINSLISKIVSRYGKDKLCFILPIHRYNEDNVYGEGNKEKAGAPLSTYVTLMKQILQKQEIETLQFEEEFPIPATNDGSDGLTVDGLHPNDKGHRIIAEKICEYIRARK